MRLNSVQTSLRVVLIATLLMICGARTEVSVTFSSNQSFSSGMLSSFAATDTGCSPAALVCGNLVLNETNGVVMHDAVDYLIFWLPSAYNYDNSSISPLPGNTSNLHYEQLIERYFQDISSSGLYQILQQYTDASGQPGNASLGGVFVDASPYPPNRGNKTNPLYDIDAILEIERVMKQEGWTSNHGNNEFFIFTGYGVEDCQEIFYGYCNFPPSSNSSEYYCGWHDYAYLQSNPIIYSIIPDPATNYNGSNGTRCVSVANNHLTTPNNDIIADSAVEIASHEQFESITDPLLNGWFFHNGSHEIGDECNRNFIGVEPDGSNIIINDDKYLIQSYWNNMIHGCSIDPKGNPTYIWFNFTTANGEVPVKYFFAKYFEAGTPKVPVETFFDKDQLSIYAVQNSTVFVSSIGMNLTTDNEEWCLENSINGCYFFSVHVPSYPIVFHYQYYDLVKEEVSFTTSLPFSGSPPVFTYYTAPGSISSNYTPRLAQVKLSNLPQTVWVLKGSVANVSDTLSDWDILGFPLGAASTSWTVNHTLQFVGSISYTPDWSGAYVYLGVVLLILVLIIGIALVLRLNARR